MNRQNLYLFGGFALIFSSRLFENPYLEIGIASLGVILILFPTYKRNKK